MNKSNWLAASMAAMLIFACASQKAPAEQAVSNIDAALSAIHDSAAKYAPDTLQTIEAQVATLKGDLAKGDYKAVLAAAPAVNTAVASLKQDAEAKQAAADAALAQTKQQWRALSADVPKLMADIKAQVDTLSKARKLPKGLTKASFESAKADAASLDTMWTEATTADSNEDYAGAVSKGQAVKDKAAELAHTLGVKSG
ncbi:MAG: hypothetical protein ACREVV_17740 [Steroidobacteraceae bacterium]